MHYPPCSNLGQYNNEATWLCVCRPHHRSNTFHILPNICLFCKK